MKAAPRNELETDVQARADGLVRVVLRGRLEAQTVPACWGNLERGLREAKIKTLQVDASGLRFCGGARRALLRYVNMGRMTPKATVSVLGLEAHLEKVLLGFTSEDYEAFRPKPPIETHASRLDVLMV